MKLLSIAIPSYNSQDYMTHAVESLLPGGDEVEILIVDDGSKDRTAEIAAMPEAKAKPRVPPSRSDMSASSAARVGLPVREYSQPVFSPNARWR